MALASALDLDRVRSRAAAFWPSGRAGWALGALLVAGLALRLVAAFAYWPATTTLADAYPYSSYAETDVWGSPQHPPGYSLLLATVGLLTRELGVMIAIQHLLGIAAALIMFAAVRRAVGSPWPGVAAAAVILLNADLIYLEHSIMAEGPFVFLLSASLYASVRAIRDPYPLHRWPAAAAVLLALATLMRAAGLFLIPVVLLAIYLSAPRPRRRQGHWRPAAVFASSAVIACLAIALSNLIANDRFEVGPTQGWHLYQRAAPFADCSRFEPPEGTEVLCEDKLAAERLGGDFYLYDERSPARRAFGAFGNEDGKVGAFARAAILAQPRDYLSVMWRDLKAYWVPSSRPYVDGAGGDLDPQLDWEITLPPDSAFDTETKRITQEGMEIFFDPFEVDQDRAGIEFLDTVQRITRFGGTLLSLTTLLTVLGLLIGPARSRIAVLLFGVGGLALLVAPTASAIYIGRYTVPIAALMVAAAAIALMELARLERRRRARAAEGADAASRSASRPAAVGGS